MFYSPTDGRRCRRFFHGANLILSILMVGSFFLPQAFIDFGAPEVTRVRMNVPPPATPKAVPAKPQTSTAKAVPKGTAPQAAPKAPAAAGPAVAKPAARTRLTENGFEYKDSFSDGLRAMYAKLGLPFRPSLWAHLAFLFLGIIVAVYYVVTRDDHNIYEEDFEKALVVQVGFVLACLVTAIICYHAGNVSERVSRLIGDPALEAAALKHCIRWIIIDMFLGPILFFFIMDVGFATACTITDSILRGINSRLAAYEKRLTAELRRTLDDAGIHARTAFFREDGTIELADIDAEISAQPIPRVSLKKTIARTVPFPEFFRLVSRRAGPEIEETGKAVAAAAVETTRGTGNRSASAVLEMLCGYIDERTTELTLKLRAGELPEELEDAEQLLQSASADSLKRFQQDIVATAQETLRAKINGVRDEIADAIAQHINKWETGEHADSDMSALPDGTKFFLRNGDHAVFVIEQAPQMRTMLAGYGLVRGCDDESGRRFHLAFPYIVFVLKFYRGSFSELYVAFRNKPLQSVHDELHSPCLPNTYRSLKVCRGGSGHEKERSLGAKARAVITDFWNSTFNSDLAEENYSPSRELDPRLETLNAWERASKDDPLFVLRIPWIASMTLDQLIGSTLTGEDAGRGAASPDTAGWIRKAIDGGEKSLATSLMSAFAELKLDRSYPKAVRTRIGATLQSYATNISNAYQSVLDETILTDAVSLLEEFDETLVRQLNALVDQEFRRGLEPLLGTPRVEPPDVYPLLLGNRGRRS